MNASVLLPCSVIAALDDASDTLNEVFGDAFDGFTFGEECGDKCIDWSLTYSQVRVCEGGRAGRAECQVVFVAW